MNDQASIDRVYNFGVTDGHATLNLRRSQALCYRRGEAMANLEIFRNDPSVRAFAPNELIFEAGGPGDAMFVVVEGSVDLRLPNGTLIATVGPGDVFGEMALISDKPRSASASARDGVRVAPIDARRFTYLVQNTPYFALEVMRTLAERVRIMNDIAHGQKSAAGSP